MKKVFFFGLIILLLIVSCAKQESKFPQGAWQLVQTQNVVNGKEYSMVINPSGSIIQTQRVVNGKGEVTFPVATWTGSQIKMWSEKHWSIVGEWIQDTLREDVYSGGTYTIDGNQYEETIRYHYVKAYVGKTLKMTLELKNDTLIQIYQPVDSTGRQIEKTSFIEKRIQLK